MSKKQKRRDMVKYPALRKELNLKSRQDLIDYDYLDKLSNYEKEWLNKFTEEYTIADLDRENLDKNIHKTKEYKKDIDKRNNLRKECIYTKAKAGSKLKYLEDAINDSVDNNYEDRLIEYLDNKNKK